MHPQRRSRLRGRRAAPARTRRRPLRSRWPVTRAVVIAAEAFRGRRRRGSAGCVNAKRPGCRRGRGGAGTRAGQPALSQPTASQRRTHTFAISTIADVQRVRLGYGTGDDVVEGFVAQGTRDPARARKAQGGVGRMLSPQEEMAGMMSGRRPAGRPSEELLLRARLDLDHGRPRRGRSGHPGSDGGTGRRGSSRRRRRCGRQAGTGSFDGRAAAGSNRGACRPPRLAGANRPPASLRGRILTVDGKGAAPASAGSK